MEQKKFIVDNNIYEVVTYDEYVNNKSIFNPKYTAIESGEYVLPIVAQNSIDTNIGAVCNDDSAMYQVHLPETDEEKEKYSINNVIDFSKAKSITELVNTQECIRNIENEMLTSPENIFIARITNEDTEEMKALKEAVNLKGIDFKDYERRFGINAPNDKRGLQESTVSFKKLRRYAKAFDMKVQLTISDASDDVPNPIGKVIVKDITEINDSDGDEE